MIPSLPRQLLRYMQQLSDCSALYTLNGEEHVPCGLKTGEPARERFEGPRGAVIPATAKEVAMINRMMAAGVGRFIYSTDEDFVWEKEDGKIADRRDLFHAIKEHEAKKAATPATAKPATEKPVEVATEAESIKHEG